MNDITDPDVCTASGATYEDVCDDFHGLTRHTPQEAQAPAHWESVLSRLRDPSATERTLGRRVTSETSSLLHAEQVVRGHREWGASDTPADLVAESIRHSLSLPPVSERYYYCAHPAYRDESFTILDNFSTSELVDGGIEDDEAYEEFREEIERALIEWDRAWLARYEADKN